MPIPQVDENRKTRLVNTVNYVYIKMEVKLYKSNLTGYKYGEINIYIYMF